MPIKTVQVGVRAAELPAGNQPVSIQIVGIADTIRLTDGAISSSSSTFTSTSASFTSADIGKAMIVVAAGASGATLVTTIAALISPTQVTLASSAGSTVTDAVSYYGTNNTAAIQAAVNTVSASGTGQLDFEAGNYLTTSPIDVEGRKVLFNLGAGFWVCSSNWVTADPSTLVFPYVDDGGSFHLLGRGRSVTKLYFTSKTVDAVTLDAIQKVTIADLDMICDHKTSTTRAIHVYRSSAFSIRNAFVQDFDRCVEVQGTSTVGPGNSGPERGTFYWITDCEFRNFRTFGVKTSHCVGVNINHLMAYAVTDEGAINPTGAWGLIIDSDTSGFNFQHAEFGGCGLLIRHTDVGLGYWQQPPTFGYFEQLVVDTMPTPGIYLDASLAPGDNGLAGRSFHFVDSWSAFSTVDGDPCVKISGGQDISFTECRFRVGRTHGVYCDGGEDIRFVNCISNGNNIQDVADGSGFYFDDGVGNFTVIGCRSGETAGDGAGDQNWGAYVASGVSSPYTILGCDFLSNTSGPVKDLGSSGFKTVMFNTGGSVTADYPFQRHAVYFDKGRFEFGDGSFYLDFKESTANTTAISWDSTDFLRYYRALNRWDWEVGGLNVLRFVSDAASGITTLGIQSRPTASGGLDRNLLNSSLDADVAERFNITGRGQLTWGDGATVDLTLKRLAAQHLSLTGRLGIEVPTISARLHLAGGTGVTGYAPIKIAPGVLLSSVEDGSLEYDGGGLYFTIGSTRRRISPIGGTLGLQIQVKGTGTTSETLDLYDIDETKAFSTLTITGVPSNGHTVTIATTTYTFVNALTGANQVAIFPTKEECLFNLYCAINDISVWEGYLYGTGTTAHATCEAQAQIGATMKVQFRTPGTSGNGTDVAFSGPFSWSADPMSGGAAAAFPHKYLRVSSGALVVRNNAFSNDIFSLSDDGVIQIYGNNSAPTGSSYSSFGTSAIRFARSITEESNSASIQRIGADMAIVGIGSSGSNRIARIYDHLGIGNSPPITATGGNLSVAGWIGVGTTSVTSGKIFEVVGGTARFGAGVQIEGTLYMPGLTASTLLGLDTGNNVVSAASLPLGISSGGTGETTASNARSALGAAAASHVHAQSDIVDLLSTISSLDARITALEGG